MSRPFMNDINGIINYTSFIEVMLSYWVIKVAQNVLKHHVNILLTMGGIQIHQNLRMELKKIKFDQNAQRRRD